MKHTFKIAAPALLAGLVASPYSCADKTPERPNVVFIFVDEWRAQDIGYTGNTDVITPNIDRFGDLQQAIKDAGMEDNTIFVFTSDHGYMIHSQGWFHKQVPYEESIHVPFLLKYPPLFGRQGQENGVLVNTPDIMPTLLGLSNLPIPESVEGRDLTGILTGKETDDIEAVLIACYQPFGQWSRRNGGIEYRGVRTKQYTYAVGLDGPWLMFDNMNDPYQMNNLIHDHRYAELRDLLHGKMKSLLKRTSDSFEPGMNYIEQWDYVVDHTETIPYSDINFRGGPIVE